jgi:hypothetical protein
MKYHLKWATLLIMIIANFVSAKRGTSNIQFMAQGIGGHILFSKKLGNFVDEHEHRTVRTTELLWNDNDDEAPLVTGNQPYQFSLRDFKCLELQH